MRFQKNSFIFFETIISILLLSGIIAVFIHIPLTKESSFTDIQTIENQFLLKQYDQHFTSTSKQIIFKKNHLDPYEIETQQITYQDEKVKLHAYEF